ncbi:MAG: hypothetical protein ACFFKA_00195 [Candidatus Thorarchaeota archaeon]
MKQLGKRNITLLSMGAKMMGKFIEAYYYIEEELYVNEADTIYRFCEWIDNEIGGASSHNMEQLFKAFINPNDEKAMEFAMDIKAKIARIKSY